MWLSATRKEINKKFGKSENGFNEKIKIYKGVEDSQYPLCGFSSIKSISYFLYNNKKNCFDKNNEGNARK